MLDEVRSLLALQDLDRRIIELTQDLEKLPQEEARARTKLADDEKAVADAKDTVNQHEIALKNLELDAETRKTTIARLKTQQFETRKNEEFAALGDEITRYGDEITSLEDSELELMELGETLAATLKEAEEKLAGTQALVDEELAVIAERKKNSEARIADIKADRAKHAAGIEDEDDLEFYEAIFKKKGDAAVVPLQHEQNCGGCHMKLIKDTIMKVKAANEITQCQQCGRILYEE